MRIVLADLRGAGGFVHKDTIVGGYGARLRPFSGVTWLMYAIKKRLNDVPSVQMATLAAILAREGHEVLWTRDRLLDGDVALVLSSLVDHRNETRWARAARARGLRVGFVGLAASKLPFLFADSADFVIDGEPEAAVARLARGETLEGICRSHEIADLDSLPFPRWDLVGVQGARRIGKHVWTRPTGGFPVLASRSCPEFCTYCPHRILSTYRARSVASIVEELRLLCESAPEPFVIFRDPLFTQDRERCLQLCEAIVSAGLRVAFECETRLDRLDDYLLARLHAAGCRTIDFGVESVSPEALRRVGRRPIAEDHQRRVIATCDRLGIRTVAFYVLGLPTDTWSTVAATIDYSIALGSTLAQFKMLTPYPATPLWKQLGPLVYEADWERFDGFTPTFRHPSLSAEELRFLLAAAYARFYLRPSFFARYWGAPDGWLRRLAGRLDPAAFDLHAWREAARMSRPVAC
jgi:anaerobic magnesium-protoporphyrin IX monomethyl ester cyclase